MCCLCYFGLSLYSVLRVFPQATNERELTDLLAKLLCLSATLLKVVKVVIVVAVVVVVVVVVIVVVIVYQ